MQPGGIVTQLEVRATTDPVKWAGAVGGFLARSPAHHTVLLTQLGRALVGDRGPLDRWSWALRDGKPVLALMNTDPFAAYLSDGVVADQGQAAAVLAEESWAAVPDEAMDVAGVGGPAAAAEVFARQWGTLSGAPVRLVQELALLVCREPRSRPGLPGGHLRLAEAAELPQLTAWAQEFSRETTPHRIRPVDRLLTLALAERRLWVWCAGEGPQCLVLTTAPAIGVIRIALVYVPPVLRGLGSAAAALEHILRHNYSAGYATVLYVDITNDRALRLYLGLGFAHLAHALDFSLLE